jgi:hypothetical protein
MTFMIQIISCTEQQFELNMFVDFFVPGMTKAEQIKNLLI